MATLNGGAAVKSGYYWSLTRWEIVPVGKDGDRLSGESQDRFLRVPLWIALVLPPLMGALFLVFLPIIGFVLTLQALAMKLGRLFKRSAGELASTVSPGWQPGEAHLTGAPAGSGAEEKAPPPGSGALDALQRELDEKRGTGSDQDPS